MTKMLDIIGFLPCLYISGDICKQSGDQMGGSRKRVGSECTWQEMLATANEVFSGAGTGAKKKVEAEKLPQV